MNQRIYLDHNSNTPVDPLVLQAMLQELQEEAGNPSSIHFHGQKSRRRLEQSRQTIARFLQVKPHEIFFTSGGTEGACLLLSGVMQQASKGHIITSATEHACVYQTIKFLELQGYTATFLSPGPWGAVCPEEVSQAIGSDTRLIALMAVNNETGVKTDIQAIASLAHERQIPFIVDGVALLGKESFSIPLGVSAMFFSGHKIHGPKGIGFCFCRQTLKLAPFFMGGSQEFNRRAGTENLPGIVGLATAISILEKGQEGFSHHMEMMRRRLEEGLKSALPDSVINGEGPRTVNTVNVSFLGVDGESLLMNLDMEGVSVSHGSACTSGGLEPSRILLNMGISLKLARSSIRFSLGRTTTVEEIDRALEIVVRVVGRLRR